MEFSEEGIGLDQGAEAIVLDNGLTLILRESHEHPVVSAQLWCRAGSVNEGAYLGAGLSHALEHMLFKGTATRPPGKIDEEVQDMGGQMNAYTSYDHTVYWISAPSEATLAALDILTDIAQNSTLPEEEWETEKQVILREMDMCEDDPSRRASRRFFETVYRNSPFREPIIGRRDIFDTITRTELLDYYRNKYSPNNLFFVIVGAFDRDAVVSELEARWTGVPARALGSGALPEEPRQVASRMAWDEGPFQLAHLNLGWNAPDSEPSEVAALDVLSTILAGGRSSRLYRELRERQGLVHGIDAWLYHPGPLSLFGVSAVLEPQRCDAARRAIDAALADVFAGSITEAETEKAVKQTLASTISQYRTSQGQAQELGSSWLVAGDLRFGRQFIAKVRDVTPEDIQRVAQRRLAPGLDCEHVLAPNGSRASVRRQRATSASSEIERVELSNGMVALLKREDRLPLVDVRFVFRGGTLIETEAKNGVTRLMTSVLPKGTPTRDSETIMETLESVGAHIETYCGANSIGMSLECMDEDLGLALDVSSDCLRHANFPPSVVERERETQLAAIRAQKDRSLRLALLGLRRALYGAVGYGLPSLGGEESLSNLSVDDLARTHRERVTPGNGVVAIYGCVDRDRTVELLERSLEGWSGDGLDFPKAPNRALDSIARVAHPSDKTQAVISLGFLGATLTDPKGFALEVIQEACNDMGSRLFTRVREERGLAYYVGCENVLGVWPGRFDFYAGAEPEALKEIEEEFLREAKRLRDEGLSDTELQRAKAKIRGRKLMGKQDLGSEALVDALNELYGLGYRYGERELAEMERVDRRAIQEAAEAFLDPERFAVSIVGPSQD